MRTSLLLALVASLPLFGCVAETTTAEPAPAATTPSQNPSATPPAGLSEADRALARQLLLADYFGDFVGTRATAAGEEPVSVKVDVDTAVTTVRCGDTPTDLRCITTTSAVLPARVTVSFPNQDRQPEVLFGRAVMVLSVPESGSGTRGENTPGGLTDGPAAFPPGRVLTKYFAVTLGGVEAQAVERTGTYVLADEEGSVRYTLTR